MHRIKHPKISILAQSMQVQLWKKKLFTTLFDNDINFTYEPETEVEDSCAATLDDEMFVLGGWNQKRQGNTQNWKIRSSYGEEWPKNWIKIIFFKISKVQDCKLKRVGEMPFDFWSGGCNTFDFGVMLCFSSGATKECHS